MDNKILIVVFVPSIEDSCDVFIPINKKIGVIKNLLEKGINELREDGYTLPEDANLYSKETGNIYYDDELVVDTDLENGSRVVLI